VNGAYLLPALYNRLINPGEVVAGWLIAEYPKDVISGNLIGEMRISLQDVKKQWSSAKTFAAHPTIYPNDGLGKVVISGVIQPLDFFIIEN
jgi:hypothetical protein